jgi:hypothetical protein
MWKLGTRSTVVTPVKDGTGGVGASASVVLIYRTATSASRGGLLANVARRGRHVGIHPDLARVGCFSAIAFLS